MVIHYETVDIKSPKIKRRATTNWIKTVAAQYQKRVGEISYIFCSDAEILRINNLYLKHDYYTDIITFDYSEGDILSGDLFISLETVKSNSEQFGTDYDEELRRVMIHGVLHLCGFKDKSSEDEKVMREKENEALSRRGGVCPPETEFARPNKI
ncbi:endoribonuclease YbeY [Bacteroidia bacterium]|nr:endoribonuclease YbeY [Bacteroidia bacterium]GHT04898.1 endoribonuclease YbeY [Bacteroidia bacterium]GHT52951.1 endoribonuclease YbeY [Bacteroidia bacterium]